jgi:hypothetical protein
MRPGEQLRIYLTPSKQLLAAEKAGLLFQVPQQTCTGGAALNGSYWPILLKKSVIPNCLIIDR